LEGGLKKSTLIIGMVGMLNKGQGGQSYGRARLLEGWVGRNIGDEGFWLNDEEENRAGFR